MPDYLFRGTLKELDPAVFELTQLEAERQVRRLILIPSESFTPMAVRDRWPPPSTISTPKGIRTPTPAGCAKTKSWITKNAWPTTGVTPTRYYKGVEYANIVEALARRRAAELFAVEGFGADDIFVNVQPLSGAPANNAVYTALLQPGDVLMGMDLFHGGHLSHGSEVNRSGKLYKPVHYTVDPETERLDYDAIAALAQEHRPKIIVAGYSSYPWSVDWNRFRQIADSVGAYLLADISHVSGLVVTGEFPRRSASPT